MLALVGESGCGKTTTAQAILRLVEPDWGVIRFRGTDITHLRARELRPLRREMQMIYQDPYESLDPRFRVRATVEEPLQVHGLGGSRAERGDRVLEALARAGLSTRRCSSAGILTALRAGRGSGWRSPRV